MARKYIIILLCLARINIWVYAQQTDFSTVFGNDWNKALLFLKENDLWMRDALSRYGIPYNEAVALVFPELVRYSAIRDKMETGVLKALYVNLGQEYANFSIGQFQIKPSFAEKIREVAASELGKTGRELFGRKQPEERELRSLVVNELENPQSEFRYVIAFYLICTKKFGDLSDQADERIRFLASAYNTGFWKDKSEIEMMAGKKFYSTKLIAREFYSYSDVALFWYNNYADK